MCQCLPPQAGQQYIAHLFLASGRGSVVSEIQMLANLLKLDAQNLSHPKSKGEM